MVVAAVTHILLFKRDSRAALAWIGFCLVFPFFGPLIYLGFGVNRVQTRAQALRGSDFSSRHHSWLDYERGDGYLGEELLNKAETDLPPLHTVGFKLSHFPLRPGNKVETLLNGDQTYPAMLEAISTATHTILLCSYIFRPDTIGNEFVDALVAAKKRGVEVHVIVDGVGEYYSFHRVSRKLNDEGIPAVPFLPPKLWPPTLLINLRTHRKILAIDNDLVFVGGINISDLNMESAGQKQVIDTHFKLQGQIARDVQLLFIEDWKFLTGEDLALPNDTTVTYGETECRLVSDGPNEEMDRISMLYVSAISTATFRVNIMTPYFLPPQNLIGAITAAALRGVEVNLLLPEKSNIRLLQWASHHGLWELLQWGVNVYYQPSPFVHSKLLLIDDSYSFIGSANLDARSLRLNFELGVEVFGVECNAELNQHFDSAILRASKVGLDDLLSRSVPQRLRDAAAALFTPYL